MKKWTFWTMMALCSLVNGGLFYLASRSLMERGVAGVDNQGALLLVPLLWIAAGAVLVVLNTATAVQGRSLTGEDRVALLCFAGAEKQQPLAQAGFLLKCALLMALGCCLVWGSAPLLNAAYVLTGGGLLVLLEAWKRSCRKALHQPPQEP